MAQELQIAAIVLAAGRSSRMGAHKLLLPLGGRPLLSYAVEAACASAVTAVIVVLGHNAEAARVALPAGRYQVVVNYDYAQGMAGSLRVGLGALPATVSGVLVALADQPLVTVAIFTALLTEAARQPEQIVAASYDGKRGHPLYFPRSLFDELRAVRGDEGGRSVIARHADQLRLVSIADADAALDVDRPEDYTRIQATVSHRIADRDS
ncbi:MAG: nucleotidyltransferase family protein [Ktedonobacterales bacterium]